MSSYTRLIVLFAVIALTNANNGFSQQTNKKKTVSLQIDGSKRYQQMDGIGVNANTQGWNGDDLKPALNLLLDSMNATIWRVIVETQEKWEEENDNDDPFSFNWDYYNKLYETPKFQKAWEMIGYLNSRGITKNLMINFMGAVPAWMGKKTIKPEYEDEYVEMIASFFYYARNKKHLQFGLVSPTNESDLVIADRNEGPELDEKQYARILRKLVDRMAVVGMGDIRYVAPDVAGMDLGVKKYIPEMMKDPAIMSKVAHIGLHSYFGYYANIDSLLKQSAYPNLDFWITEWNNWCEGCDDGILGEYNYNFADKSIGYLLDLIKNGATAAMVWEGYDSYYEHHAPSPFSYWGMLAYEPKTKTYSPRKNFYAFQQVSKFVLPGAYRISVSEAGDGLTVLSFYNAESKRVSIVGINRKNSPVQLSGALKNLPAIDRFEQYRTSDNENLFKDVDVKVNGNSFSTLIPANCIFTLTGSEKKNTAIKNNVKPEPPNWYAGDIHVHLNCGEGTAHYPYDSLASMMEPNDLAVISVLADMGNGEVKDSKADLPKVNGKDAPQSKPGRIIHWDAEWHWDASYSNFQHQALGGHLVLLGLNEAHQVWQESPYKILEWAKKQNAISGLCHFQYLNDSIQNELNCCIPIDYPVEAALGTVDFISEDVYGTHSANVGIYDSEAAINAYYKLLNCGFRLGLTAATDFPCNNYEPLGTLLTYVKVKDKLTYRKWIEGIKNGKTVVSRNGHNEFLNMRVNGKYEPGDELFFTGNAKTTIEVEWTAAKPSTGRIELVSNGQVVATQLGTVEPGKPVTLKATVSFNKSGWICARRMDENGHQTHTAPVYVTVNQKPVRASVEDANFFVSWIDNILGNIKPGGKWNKFFPNDLDAVTKRYTTARNLYAKIATEAASVAPSSKIVTHLPSPNDGPGGPILVISKKSNPFSHYAVEILRAEGLNEFAALDISEVSAGLLKNYDVVLLGEMDLSPGQVTMLTNWTNDGGVFIALKPDQKLNALLGVKVSTDKVLADKYLLVNTTSGPGVGIVNQTMQYHGPANLYSLNGATQLATLYSDAVTATAYPAITINGVGTKGGSAIAFSYDLAKSIIYTRQGNPAWAGMERDGQAGPIRSDDLYFGNKPGDSHADWVDLNKVAIPHADEQQRLLTNIILQYNLHRKPLPRFWFLPRRLKAAVVMTGDDHANNGTTDRFKHYLSISPSNTPEAVDDWTAIRGTSYLFHQTPMTNEQAVEFEKQGFEIGLHLNTECGNYTLASLKDSFTTQLSKFAARFPGISNPVTHRTHCIAWSDWVSKPKVELLKGIRLNTDYYYWPGAWVQDRPGMFTGSGMPMRFADLDGTIIDNYQVATQMTDESDITYSKHINLLLDNALGTEGYYGVFCANMHTDENGGNSSRGSDAIIEAAMAKKVPVISAKQMLTWLDGRNASSFGSIVWKNNELSFNITAGKGAKNLWAMLPYNTPAGSLVNLKRNGIPVPVEKETIKGITYIFFEAGNGNYVAQYR